MVVCNNNFFVLVDCAALDTSDTDSADVIVVVDGRNKNLNGSIDFSFGSGECSL